MQAKTISILGCGWLGKPLGEALIVQGYIVKGSTTRQERLTELEAAGILPYQIFAEAGSWKGESLREFLVCDTLIIAIPPGTRKNAASTHAVEIKSLLQLINEQSISIPRIVYISSTSVYKNNNQIAEEGSVTSILDTDNVILADAEMSIMHSSIQQKLVFRLGGLTGYNRMLARFFAGKKELAGGNEPVNLLHRDDAVCAIVFLLKKDSGDQTYNICSPEHPVKRAFYTDLCNRFGLEMPDFPERLNGDWKLISTEKIQQLGYEFAFPDPYRYTYS